MLMLALAVTQIEMSIRESGGSVEVLNFAIVAFRFYDQLTQRLNHVTSSLGSLADLVSDQRRLYSPYE